MWVERGEAHEEEGEDEEDKDEPPECVNHTHRQRDGQGAHKNQIQKCHGQWGGERGLTLVNRNC